METQISNGNQDDLISLADIIQVIIKHIKLFAAILTLGIPISFVAFSYKENNYNYNYYLSTPQYYSGSSYQNMLTSNELNDYLSFYLIKFIKSQKTAKQQAYAKRITIDGDFKQARKINNDENKSPFFVVGITGKKSDNKIIKSTLNNYIQYAQRGIQKDVIQKQKLGFNLKKNILKEQYSSMLALKNKFNQEILKDSFNIPAPIKTKAEFSKTKLDSDAYSALTAKNFDLSLELINLESQIKALTLSINSIQNLEIQEGLIQSEVPVGLTKKTVLIFGILFSIFLSCLFPIILELIIPKIKSQ